MSKNDSNNVAGVRKIIGKYRYWGRQIFLGGKESIKSREVSSLVFISFFFFLALPFLNSAATRWSAVVEERKRTIPLM